MIAKKVDDDYLVDNDTDQETSEEESEEKDQREEGKKYDLEWDKSEPDERYQRESKELFKWMKTPTKWDDADIFDTDTDQETNNE